jgi:hypothetical protein
MLRKTLTTALLLACTVVAGAQSTLTGKWQGSTDGGASILLDLTVKGDALSGTLTRDGQSSPLSEGKVTKNTFSFKATLNDKAEALTGEMKDEELRVWLDRQGPEKAVVFTRVKSAPSKGAEQR